jgi:hypothetical protein
MKLPNNTIPVVIGAGIGMIALTVLSFSNGWVVSSQRMATELQQANITVQAEVCAARAEAYLKETNNTDDFQGFQTDASARRTALASNHVTSLEENEASTTTIINACAGLLNKPRA